MASYENKQMPFEIEKQNQNGVERERAKKTERMARCKTNNR